MSTSIENSVVSMSFENQDFEKNAKTTMSTLDKLRKALDFSGTAETLNEVSDAADNVDFSTLQNGVTEVHNRFSALEVMAITVLSRITNAAIDAGVRIGKALTIDSIMGGFSEYELMMNSVQTIMSGTGESLDTVMDKLNELNQYADDTIYVFSDMTKNIGKFTNAGIDLNTSVAAMKGLSNEAALAGANAEEASRAMYNIAQSLSMGYMQYIDWKSIENANMATKDFKENLVETALEMGTLSEAAVSAQPSINALFKDGLKDGWLTNDVLLGTLEKYADETTELGKKAYAAAQDIKTFHQMWDTLIEAAGSGWAQTFGYIIGDFEQAKQLWTGIGTYLGDVIGRSAQARNELFKVWNETGGRDHFINGLSESFHAMMKIVGNINLAFHDIFKGLDNNQLMDISLHFEAFATQLNKKLAPVAKDIRHTFDGLFAVLHIGVNIVTSIGRAFAYLIGNSGLGGLSTSILGVTGNFGSFLKGLDESITKNDTFFKILKKVADVLLLIPNGLSAVFQALTGMGFSEAIGAAADNMGNFFGWLQKLFDLISGNLSSKIQGLKDAFKGLGTETGILEIIFKGVANGLSSVAGVVLDIVTTIGNAITTTFGQADFRNMADFINTAGLAGGLSAFLLQLKNLMDPLDDIGDAITNLREDLAIMQTAIKADAILKIAEAVALLAVSCLLLASIDANKLVAPLAAITASMTELMSAFALIDIFSSSSDTLFGSLSNIMDSVAEVEKSKVMLTLAESILILAAALKLISSIEPDRLGASLGAITLLLSEVTAAALILSNLSGKIKPGGFVGFGLGLLIISGALKVIASIDPARMGQAIWGMTLAIVEMTTALSILSQMRVTGLLTAGAALLAASGAMLVLATSLKLLSTIDRDSMMIGVVAMLGTLAIVTTALTALSFMNPVGLIAGAAALTVASGAILVLSGALMMLSTLSGSGMNTALISLFSSLTMLAAALLVMRTALPGAAALIVAAGAIAILVPSLVLLSAIPFETMMLTLAGLAIAIAGLAAASLLLSPVLPLMAALSGTLALFGVACLAVGGGVALLAAGLAMLAVSGVAGATALVGVLAVIVGAIPMIVDAIALFVVTLLEAYMEIMPQILEAVVMTITMVCEALITCLPLIVETGLQLIVSFLTSLRNHLPEILILGTDIILELLTGIENALPQLIDKAFKIMIAFIEGLGQAIEDNAEDIRNCMISFGTHLWNAFCEFFGIHSPSTVMAEGGVYLIQGLIDGIGGMINAAKTKIGEIKNAIVNKLKEKATEFIARGKAFITNLNTGMENMRTTIKNKANSIALAAKNKMAEMKDKFKDVGKNFIQGLKDGIAEMKDAVVEKASEIGNSILGKFKDIFSIHSPSRVTFGYGEFIDMGFINGMENLRTRVADKAAHVANSVITALTTSIADVKDDIDDVFDFTPVFKPVVDLTGIQNGASRIKKLLDNTVRMSADEVVTRERDNGRSRTEQSSNVTKQEVTNNYTFNQTNNSPKALDTYTIYRQGRNLLSQIEGAPS